MDIGIRCRKVGFRLVFVVMEYWNASRRMRDVIIVHRKPVRRVDPFFLYLIVYDLIIMLEKLNKIFIQYIHASAFLC